MNRYLKKVMIKMCEYVGVNYDSIDFKSERWFCKHTWTPKQEDDFRNWFIDLLKNDDEARKSLLAIGRNSDDDIQDAVDFFIFNYGWTTAEEIGRNEKNSK